jgi:quercetin dioxygenase-like cupin family protein
MHVVQVTLALLLFGTASSFAQGGHPDLLAGPDAVKWGPAPPTLPAGGQIAIISGDPSKEGPFVLRLKMPPGYQIPAHHHSRPEGVTVISGDFYAGMGDKLNRNDAQSFKPGGFVGMPANMNHYALAGSETVIQVHGQGPFDIVYVNPEDAPSKQ